MYTEKDREKDIERIRELETELLRLRLRSRHFDFIDDYERDAAGYPKAQRDKLQKSVVNYLRTLDEPIRNNELIRHLVSHVLPLTEYDLEKTNSGNIRIFSAIRSAVVDLQDRDIIAKAKKYGIKSGYLILTENYTKWADKIYNK
jgi:hypothetical protein